MNLFFDSEPKTEQSLFEKSKNIVELKPEHFARNGKGKVTLSGDFEDKNGIVTFYAHWCGHCVNFVKIYERFADLVKGVDKGNRVIIGAFDCANESQDHKQIANGIGIEGYPTIKFIKHGEISDTFEGERTVTELLKQLCDKLEVCIAEKSQARSLS